MVTADHFERALADVRPAFGVTDVDLAATYAPDGMLLADPSLPNRLSISEVLDRVPTIRNRIPLASLYLCGPAGTGRSATALQVAQAIGYDFVRVFSPASLAGSVISDSLIASKITELLENAYRAPESVVVLDDLEDLIEYGQGGLRYSQIVLQTVRAYLRKTPPAGHKMVIIATATSKMPGINVNSLFNVTVNLQPLTVGEVLDTTAAYLETRGIKGVDAATLRTELDVDSFKAAETCIPIKALMFEANSWAKTAPESTDDHLEHIVDSLRTILPL
ncbi:hypothetical protein KIPB_008781 [Kipferlia bialata]|uniref:Vesicle-fusing ATPase n=1 Tax=Kipferlia bialata TaxID=797122 RepID=A0A9K3D3W3_9EUKA|nr:hypothetical protein KIPB_008781 [Kipferlia bialata]|eukprot:g8781.t1